MTDKKAGNSVHEERMAVFNDPEAWIRSDPRLRASVEEAIKRTGVYYEDDYPPFDPNTVRDEVISVTGERSFQACMRLAGEKPGSRIAAPDLRERSNRYAGLARGGTSMNRAELFGCHVKRAIHMLTVAAHRGADTLVPGAFGCGAFRNDPAVVAEAYKVALEVFPKVFGRVVFAVYCTQDRHENYETFKSVLEG